MVSKERFLDLTLEWELGAVLLFLGFNNQLDALFFPLTFLPIVIIGGIFGVFLFISLGRIERNTTLSRQFLQWWSHSINEIHATLGALLIMFIASTAFYILQLESAPILATSVFFFARPLMAIKLKRPRQTLETMMDRYLEEKPFVAQPTLAIATIEEKKIVSTSQLRRNIYNRILLPLATILLAGIGLWTSWLQVENIIRNPFSIFFLFFALVFFTGFVFSLKAKFVHRILFSQEGIDITPYDGDAMHLSSNEIQNIHVSEVYSNETHFTVISKKDFPALHSLLWLNMPYKQAIEILTQCQFLQGQRLTSMNGMQQANFQFKLPNSI